MDWQMDRMGNVPPSIGYNLCQCYSEIERVYPYECAFASIKFPNIITTLVVAGLRLGVSAFSRKIINFFPFIQDA